MFLLVAVPTYEDNAFIRNAAMSVWRDAAEGTWQLSGPKQTKLLAQFFPIAVSGNDELMIDASRCPERIVECVKEAPTLSSVKAFSSGVAGCAMKFRLKYPILP